jgi:hypothetical protein
MGETLVIVRSMPVPAARLVSSDFIGTPILLSGQYTPPQGWAASQPAFPAQPPPLGGIPEWGPAPPPGSLSKADPQAPKAPMAAYGPICPTAV